MPLQHPLRRPTLLSIVACLALGCSGAPRGGSTKPDPTSGTQPFGGKAQALPGVVEAEHFDEGPEGKAFADADPQNQGAPYRQTSVDIEPRSDASGGYGVGWTKAGEWLVYTVEIAESGTYKLEVPAASAGNGGTFHIEVDGADRTGPIQVPNTGSWQKLQTISKDGIRLDSGRRLLRVVMDTEGETKSVGDMDYFRFTRTGP